MLVYASLKGGYYMDDKYKKCLYLAKKIASAKSMVGVEYDVKRKQFLTKKQPLPDGLKVDTINYINKLSTSNENIQPVHSGLFNFAEGFKSYFTIENGKVVFVIEEDQYNQKKSYSSACSILYGVYQSQQLKRITDYREDEIFEYDGPSLFKK